MFFCFLTVIFWSASSIASARTAKHLGGARANLARLTLSVGLVAAWILLRSGWPQWPPAAWWFVASGVVGLGLGDIALFSAYARIGARLPAVLTHCLGAPLGAALEWAWLGTPLHLGEGLCIAVILGGVVIALAPDRQLLRSDRSFLIGCGLGALSAVGLAVSAVMSRQGFNAADAAGTPIGGVDSAFLRNLGGLVLCIARFPLTTGTGQPIRWRAVAPWLAFTTLVGPTIGVACYQLALAEVKVGVVQAVISLVPLVVIPLAWAIDGDRPCTRAWAGVALGVAGVAGMALLRQP